MSGGFLGWQASFLRWIQSPQDPVLAALSVVMSRFGDYASYPWIAGAITWLFGAGAGLESGMLAVAGMILSDGVKDLLHVARPIGIPGIRSLYTESAEGASFPSGHSLVAAAVFGRLADRLYSHSTTASLLLYAVPIAIGTSRLYTGVHWPLDVAGGWLAGAVLSFGVLRRIGENGPAGSDSVWWLGMVLGLATVAVIPATAAMAQFVGAALAARWAGLEVTGARSLRSAGARLAVGFSGFAGLAWVASACQPMSFFTPAAQGVWTMAAGSVFSVWEGGASGKNKRVV